MIRTASRPTAVQIAERQGGRDKVLERLGSAHNDAELTALVEATRREIFPGQGELDLAAGSVPAGQSRIIGISSALLWHVLSSAYARLGFDVLGDAAIEQLVLARVVEPTSEAESVRVLDELGVPHVSLRTMFRSLARAQARGYREQIAAACFAHAVKSSGVVYDGYPSMVLIRSSVSPLRFVGWHSFGSCGNAGSSRPGRESWSWPMVGAAQAGAFGRSEPPQVLCRSYTGCGSRLRAA